MDREKVIKGLEFTKAMITFNPSTGEDIEPGNLNEANKTTYDACVGAIALLKEQEDDYKNILSDYEDLAREHEKLLDKKIPLITNGQEVVRCKDCKYAHKTYDGDCKYCDMFTDDDGNPIERYRSGDWFCADGEHKGNNKEGR